MERSIGTALTLAMLLTLGTAFARTQPSSAYDRDFEDKAMRLELYFIGDAKDEMVTLDEVYQEGLWPESRTNLIDPFNNGRYTVELYDAASRDLLYSRGFDAMFGEYRTTAPALAGVKRVFPRSVRVPWPRRPVLLVIESRDKRNVPHPVFRRVIDPADYHWIRETAAAGDLLYPALRNGEPSEKVDLVFVAEGYTADDGDKFKADVDRFLGYLFGLEPYGSRKADFNVTGVLRPSAERGMDEPRQGSFKKTGLNASFNAFDLDRYMLIDDGHRLREIAAEAPYDAIVVLVNSKRYGGGGIYNDYCVTTVDNEVSRNVFVHEFGHSFAGLADEYYTSDVAYNDFYPKGVEPLEPNITALLDPAHVKWQDLLTPGIRIPTDWGKDKLEALGAERLKNRQALKDEVDRAKAGGSDEAEIRKIRAAFEARDENLNRKIGEVRKAYANLEGQVGVFEGAGYAAKGLYRPMVYCLMGYDPKGEFCLVCRRAISRMIDYYSASSSGHPGDVK
jgi:hypothetical protein